MTALAVAVAHGLNDLYAAMLHPLLPRIMEKMGLSIALAALLATVLTIASSLLQPVMGFLADRWGPRAFVVVGPLLSGVFMSLIGAAPTFAVLLAVLVLGGLGSAIFHPPGASLAVRVAAGGSSGMRYSLFSFGGSAGFALGPLFAVGCVSAFGLERLWLAMLPALLLVPALLSFLPALPPSSSAPPPPPAAVLSRFAGPLGLVFGISCITTFVQRVFVTMEPISAAEAGASEAAGALMLSVYFAGQAGGSLLGGYLTDRMPRGRLLALLTAVSLPVHLLALAAAPGSAAGLAAAAIAGCASMALLPPIVVTAQEQLPHSAAVGSGIVMGLAWAVGATGVLLTGVLGDAIGARSAALVSTPVLIFATLLALHPALRPGPAAPPDSPAPAPARIT
jgi:FSR family fosmidomycin resistance protein-like MFS transporter